MSKLLVPLSRRLLAEALGTAILVATVVGSGIMAESTDAILVVIITILGPISGAHLILRSPWCSQAGASSPGAKSLPMSSSSASPASAAR